MSNPTRPIRPGDLVVIEDGPYRGYMGRVYRMPISDKSAVVFLVPNGTAVYMHTDILTHASRA